MTTSTHSSITTPRNEHHVKHTAWLVVGSIAAVAALAHGTFNIVQLVAHEMETQIATYDAAGIAVLDVDDDTGSVTIRSADVDQITVRARIGHGLRRSESSVHVDGDRLVVRGSCPRIGSQWCNVRYVIEVPERIDVVVRSDNDGILVTGIDGRVELHSDNGSIRASDIRGDVLLSSDNGSVRASGLTSRFVRADADNGSVELELIVPPQTVDASSDNGNVLLIVPPGDELYAVDLSTDNGDTDNGVRTDTTSDRRLTITSDNGNVTTRYSEG
jgi:hypothetical protein